MKNFKTILLASLLIGLTACNEGGGGSSTTTAKTAPVNSFLPDDPNQVQDPSTPQPKTVTYYALSRTEAPINGWPTKTYTATGYCAEIDGFTFCWSDGLKTLQWTSNNFTYGPHRYNYFELSSNGANAQTCHGGCQDDFMAAPKFVSNVLLQVLNPAKVQDVFDHGTPGTLNCMLDQGNVNCGSIVFVGAQ